MACCYSITKPLFVYQLINSFYSLIDQIMVAQIGESSVSAVATLTQIKGCIMAIGTGLSGGWTIIVARLYRAGKIEEAKKNANIMLHLLFLLQVLFF